MSSCTSQQTLQSCSRRRLERMMRDHEEEERSSSVNSVHSDSTKSPCSLKPLGLYVASERARRKNDQLPNGSLIQHTASNHKNGKDHHRNYFDSQYKVRIGPEGTHGNTTNERNTSTEICEDIGVIAPSRFLPTSSTGTRTLPPSKTLLPPGHRIDQGDEEMLLVSDIISTNNSNSNINTNTSTTIEAPHIPIERRHLTRLGSRRSSSSRRSLYSNNSSRWSMYSTGSTAYELEHLMRVDSPLQPSPLANESPTQTQRFRENYIQNYQNHHHHRPLQELRPNNPVPIEFLQRFNSCATFDTARSSLEECTPPRIMIGMTSEQPIRPVAQRRMDFDMDGTDNDDGDDNIHWSTHSRFEV